VPNPAVADALEMLLVERGIELVAGADVVVDCSDNFATRQAVNAACVRHARPLVAGAAIVFDGQISVYDTRRPESPCYACVFPPDAAFADVACSTMGVFAPLVGIIGSMQAAEALKLSIQEASGRAGKFSSEDLAKARADMAAVEKMYVDTLSEAAHAARGAAKATLEDLARHAEASGTAIGRQLRESAGLSGEAADAVRKQFDAGLHAAAASSATFTRAAAGVLAAIADTLERKKNA